MQSGRKKKTQGTHFFLNVSPIPRRTVRVKVIPIKLQVYHPTGIPSHPPLHPTPPPRVSHLTQYPTQLSIPSYPSFTESLLLPWLRNRRTNTRTSPPRAQSFEVLIEERHTHNKRRSRTAEEQRLISDAWGHLGLVSVEVDLMASVTCPILVQLPCGRSTNVVRLPLSTGMEYRSVTHTNISIFLSRQGQTRISDFLLALTQFLRSVKIFC